MNNREAMQKAFEGQKFKVFSPFKCDITKNEGGNYVHDETIFAFAWFCRGIASQKAELSSNPLQLDTDSAREYLIENLLPKFSDSTFSVYVRSALAGDFAYQLAMYLQSQAQQPYDHDLGSVLMALENAISELKGIIHNDNLKPYIAAKDKLIAYISTPESKEYWCGTCEQNVDKGCGDSACQWRYKLPPAPMNEVNKPEGDKK